MIFNLSKTKEIVLKSPNPKLYIRPHPLDAIEQVLEAKLVAVVLDHKLNFDTRIIIIIIIIIIIYFLFTPLSTKP